MINITKVKSFLSYFLASFLPLLIFITTLIIFTDLLLSIIITIPTIFASIFLARLVSYHPLRELSEGSGFLVLDISSKGVIKPLIARLDKQYITIPNVFSDIFNRNQVFSMEQPQSVEAKVVDSENKIIIEKPRKEHYFAFENFYPTFIYNSQTNTLLDKNTIGEFETKYLTKYNLNYIKVKTEELSSILRDFARYVVELSKPQSILKSKWVLLLIVVIVIVILIMLFIPTISAVLAKPTTPPQSPASGGLVIPRVE